MEKAIDENRLKSLRPYLQYSPEMVELYETVERLWKVVRAAQLLSPQAYLVAMTDYPNTAFRLSRQPAFQDGIEKLRAALAPFSEGEGKA